MHANKNQSLQENLQGNLSELHKADVAKYPKRSQQRTNCKDELKQCEAQQEELEAHY